MTDITEIPTHCWGAVVKDEGPDFFVSLEKVPVPEIGENDVLIKINKTGLCYSDIHFMLNDYDIPKMSELGLKCAGHEGAGVIVKVGSNVEKLKVGMRAGFKPIQDTCQVCEYCRSGRDNYCAAATFSGAHIDGSFQQFVKSPERYTTIIPDGVPDHVAAPIMCSAATVYSSIKASGLRAGQWAVFPGGGGGVGSQGLQFAVAMGFRTICVDTGDARREMALSIGVEHFIDFKEEDAVAEVLRLTGEGAHAVFVTAFQSYPSALGYLGTRVGAKVMCIGLPPAGKFKIDLNVTPLIQRNQTITGTLVGSLVDVDEALDFAQRGKLSLQPTIIPLSGFNEAIQKLKRGEVTGRLVVDFNQP